jgi:phosphoribosylglycinamide formyltransferase 1
VSAAPPGVVVLISGAGTNMLAIARAGLEGRMAARVAAVISDRAAAPGLAVAQGLGIPTAVLAPADFGDRASYAAALGERVEAYAPCLVVLAGFMRILDGAFVRRFAGRLLNIHPSLLPAYPGLHTHRRVLEAGDRVHGCTVHFVTEELDSGPAVIQARLPVLPDDTEQSLSARVQRWEHSIYPEAVNWFVAGRLAWHEDGPWLDGQRLERPVLRGEV